MHKKGDVSPVDIADYSVYFILGVFIFALIMGLFVVFVLKLNTQYVPEELQSSLHIQRFVNTCFSYVDTDTSRKYIGIIDYAKFNENTLADCYLLNVNTKSFGYRLGLKLGEDIKSIKTSNYNKYNIRKVIPIIIYKENKFQSGELYVDFQK